MMGLLQGLDGEDILWGHSSFRFAMEQLLPVRFLEGSASRLVCQPFSSLYMFDFLFLPSLSWRFKQRIKKKKKSSLSTLSWKILFLFLLLYKAFFFLTTFIKLIDAYDMKEKIKEYFQSNALTFPSFNLGIKCSSSIWRISQMVAYNFTSLS